MICLLNGRKRAAGFHGIVKKTGEAGGNALSVLIIIPPIILVAFRELISGTGDTSEAQETENGNNQSDDTADHSGNGHPASSGTDLCIFGAAYDRENDSYDA